MSDQELILSHWDEIIEQVRDEKELSNVSYEAWLLPLTIDRVENHVVYIAFRSEHGPGKVGIEYLTARDYNTFFRIAIEEITGYQCSSVEFVLSGEQAPAAPAEPEAESLYSLNPRYTFESFVVGSNNRMAHAACLAVAENPGQMYNPLFIYGGVGLGKTHLMQSIAHFIRKNSPQENVIYISSEKFNNELISSIRTKNMEEFRKIYRSCDVLLIDDIQFILGKEAVIEEVFHTFNELHENKKQIVFSSDRAPKNFVTLEDRLRSRFEWGLTVDIQAPDYETRVAILQKKEEIENYTIDNEVIEYIASHIKSNIRELEGALTKIVALSKLDKKEINLELAEKALKDMISPNENKIITPELIIQIVAEHYGITTNDIISDKRNKEYVIPRQIAMYLCREMTSTRLKVIGQYLGNRDHSTILYGCEKIAREIERDMATRNTVEVLKKKISP